jgi:hypothetical protein
MRKIADMNIRALYDEHKISGAKGHGMGLDQDFLIDCVYPRVTSVMMIHSSQTWRYRPFEVLNAFPFTYTNDIYCGRIEGSNYAEPPPPVAATVNRPPPPQSMIASLRGRVLKLS